MNSAQMQTNNFIEDQDIQELIIYRNIQEEDYYILENLSKFPRTLLFTHFHNFFQQLKTKSPDALVAIIQEIDSVLERDMHNSQARELKEIHEWYLEICRKYDWATADNINKVLERLQ